MRKTPVGDLYAENEYCLYNIEVKKIKNKIKSVTDREKLVKLGKERIEQGKFQLAEIAIFRALEMNQNDIELLNNYTYVNFKL